MSNIFFTLMFIFITLFCSNFMFSLNAQDLTSLSNLSIQNTSDGQDIDFAVLKKQLATMEEAMNKLQVTMEEAIKKQQEMINVLKNKIESRETVAYSHISEVEKNEIEYDYMSQMIEQTVEEYLTKKETTDTISQRGSTSRFGVYWDNGLKFKSDNENFRFKLGGRIMNDWGFLNEDRKILKDTGIGDLVDGTKFRRARLYLKGDIYENIGFEIQYDFADRGKAEFKDVYMELKKIPFTGNLRIGQFKSPFSLEYMASSNHITFMERGLNNAFVPRRNTGFMLYNHALKKRMTWATSVYRSADDFGDSQGNSSTEGGYSFAGRITGLPWYKDKGERLLHLGFSYSYQNAFENEFDYDSEPEIKLAGKFVNTGDFAAEYAHLYNPELAMVFGPFSLQAEYTFANVNTTGSISGRNPGFSGFYVYGSYFLTGEHRKYSKKDGCFSRLKPDNNFNWGNGLGAFELAARYSELDLTDKHITGGRLSDITLGLNWYLNPNTRVMLNYVHSDLDLSSINVKNGNADIFAMRFQVDL